jgi:hypothetical protein
MVGDSVFGFRYGAKLSSLVFLGRSLDAVSELVARAEEWVNRDHLPSFAQDLTASLEQIRLIFETAVERSAPELQAADEIVLVTVRAAAENLRLNTALLARLTQGRAR